MIMGTAQVIDKQEVYKNKPPVHNNGAVSLLLH